jgi:calcium permeable stress-gated cation channel
LVPALLIFLAWIAMFVILRRKFPRQYAPRTYLGSLRKQERTPAAPNTLFGWLPFMQKIPDEYVLQHNSLDGYFLLRYIKLCIVICFVGCCISWPVLFPVNATGGGSESQLNILSFSNVRADSQVAKLRYLAHVFVAWIFIGFIFFLVTREMIYYVNLRQAYLMSPLYAQRMSSRTVLFQSVPVEYADEHKIRRMFGDQLKNVWVASEVKELEEMVEERTKAAMKLEAAETKLIKLANNARLKSLKKGGQQPISMADEELGAESGSAAARWVRPKARPTHRLKPIIGKKVDTINWARGEMARLNPLIEREQNIYRAGEAKPRNAVFVEFYNQVDAQAAFQMLAHHKMLHMAPRVVGMVPEEIIWSNLGMTWKTATSRNIISIAAATALTIFWSFPVAIVGSISQINTLTTVLPWLNFINDIPQVILGVVTNLLPSVMLAILVSLVPVFFRLLGKLAGKPTLSTVELRCHESFFWFQVLQVFLVTTMTSAASSAVPTILKNPGSIPTLLAQSIPRASNFYVSYVILQGLTFAAGALVQIAGLIIFHLLGKLLDSTPRKMYTRWANLAQLGWGTVFPFQEILMVISVTYAPIAPLMMGFATIGLCLYYLAYRYNLLFVNTSVVDTKGLVYAKALKHTLVGCYLAVICLIGLLAIQYAAAPLILSIILLVVMILYHTSLNAAIDPLLYYLPRSLEAEETALLSEHGVLQSHDGAFGKNHAAKNGMVESQAMSEKSAGGQPKVSFLKKWLRPDKYCSYKIMRKMVPQDFAEIIYSPETERDAYQHPAVTNITPLLWIPRDEMGVSRQECAHTNKVTPMTDEGAHFNEKGKVVWDQEALDGRAPIYEEKIFY